MKKQAKLKNTKKSSLLKLKYVIPNVVEKFYDYYADVYKEGILDYPMALCSALVRISLHRGL